MIHLCRFPCAKRTNSAPEVATVLAPRIPAQRRQPSSGCSLPTLWSTWAISPAPPEHRVKDIRNSLPPAVGLLLVDRDVLAFFREHFFRLGARHGRSEEHTSELQSRQ